MAMRVLLAFDKFKDSLSAREACDLAARALHSRHPDWSLDLCPLADGGEGFAEILTTAADGQMLKRTVAGPRAGAVEAAFGLVPLNKIPAAARALLALESSVSFPSGATIAVIEMAAASGLALLPPEQRDPWQTSTHGTGELIRAAGELGAAAVLLGVGGSATNDLGLGALQALGLDFLSAAGKKVAPIPEDWPGIVKIEGRAPAALPPIRIACDVTNPLLGPRGAAAIYGPQKGLLAEDLSCLDHESARVAMMLCAQCRQSDSLMDLPGAGAAGGLPFGLMTAARAKLLPGFDLVAAWLDLDARLAAADIIITGEGRFDDSSRSGKGPGAVVTRALALGKRVHVFAGVISASSSSSAAGSEQLHAITPAGTPLPQAMREAAGNLTAAVQAAFRA
jgi:glycerate kinase